MSEVLKENDKQEDDAYEEMGNVLGEVNKIFGGSDREWKRIKIFMVQSYSQKAFV